MSLLLSLVLAFAADPLTPGEHTRTLKVGERERSYLIHVPKSYDASKSTPVLLAYHGAAMNGSMMVLFCGLNKTSEQHGFLVVYPDGTGANQTFLTWNAGGFRNGMANKVDDVAFTAQLLDDLATVANVDAKRVYATGMSNGGMMVHRLAAELSERIAAVAPVAGTLAIDEIKPKRAVSILHFHGTEDKLVPFEGLGKDNGRMIKLRSIDDAMQTWAKQNGCPAEPKSEALENKTDDKLKVTKKTYTPGKDGAEVVLYVVEGGGHTWPGQNPLVGFLGKTAMSIDANELMWEFFQKHPLK